MLYRFDLHIHSCLSPCGQLESSPSAIAARAKEAGLNGVMLADHNTSRNCPAFADACRRIGGLSCLCGMEVTTAEEVHALAVFDTVEQAQGMTDTLYAALPKRVNVPDVFGDQPVVNADDEIEEMEWRLLSAPTRLSLPDAAGRVHALGGLFVACHVDRPVFSALSQLGSLTGCTYFDAVELTRFSKTSDWLPRLEGLPVVRSSDAHDLDTIGKQYTEADLPAFSVAALRDWLAQRRGDAATQNI